MKDKLGQELPETLEQLNELLADLKVEYFSLVRERAPVGVVDAVRRRAASLESRRKDLEGQGLESVNRDTTE
jgi:hypothetical protein